MADLPVPRPQLITPAAGDPVAAVAPAQVVTVMGRLAAGGHAAWVVGGSVRDALLGRTAHDWDLATDALPERLIELLPGAVYENRFGTVAVRDGVDLYEITTFRSDHEYADHRRPHRVEFGTSLHADLARRDFTANAMAWGVGPGGGTPTLEDPHGGQDDVRSRLIRAVGDPAARFGEDALRMLRAIRLAAELDFAIEPGTLEGIRTQADLARHLSGERVATELARLLAVERPSSGLRRFADTGLLEAVLPELAAQRGVPQRKVEGEDLWDHTLRTVDAAPADRPVLRLAALLHDLGKPSTQADGRFLGHDVVGAELARAVLRRLRAARPVIERVEALVRHHMFSTDAAASDAAVRRFIVRVGRDVLDELLDLRAADNVGSGQAAEGGGLAELRQRVAEQLAAEVALDRSDLAIDGRDLIEGLGMEQGPRLGRLLDALLERVIADPALNDRPTLLLLARTLLDEDRT